MRERATAPGGDVSIKTLDKFDRAFEQLVHQGYRSAERYEVTKEESHGSTVITLTLRKAVPPVEVHWPIGETDHDIWRQCVAGGLSLGAYDDEGRLVGLCLVERRAWNNMLWVWDLHVLPSYQGRGIGRRLLELTVEAARREGYRAVGLETQSTNVPAITFYRRVGFAIDGIDLSYYSNEDSGGGGQVAVFMKRRLEAGTGEEPR